MGQQKEKKVKLWMLWENGIHASGLRTYFPAWIRGVLPECLLWLNTVLSSENRTGQTKVKAITGHAL